MVHSDETCKDCMCHSQQYLQKELQDLGEFSLIWNTMPGPKVAFRFCS